MRRRYELTDEQWDRVSGLLPAERGRKARPAKDNRVMVNGMVWVLRTGAPWRDLPQQYGPWSSVYTRFSRWTRQGVWRRVLDELAKDADPIAYMVDATICSSAPGTGSTPEKGAPAIGHSRGGPTTKIHALVDALGRPVQFALTEGQTHEMRAAEVLVAEVRDAYVIGDRAYDAAALRKQLKDQGCRVVIPSHPTRRVQRRYDRVLYRMRHRVENFFQRLKPFRRVATRYEGLACNFAGMVTLASALTWLL